MIKQHWPSFHIVNPDRVVLVLGTAFWFSFLVPVDMQVVVESNAIPPYYVGDVDGT